MSAAEDRLVEGEDYYFEGALVVFTGRFLLRRGYCCESGCRHCPYGFRKEAREDAPKTNERENG
ncbi:MAG: DUF5522 domain-containing protein [Acidobacteria bacterium]|nr:DUF5522 domain-containing protein [Acidobacteriota bacterium]MCA1643175.1 DUF5522 domain-containing protein [Acidobacteriota bacterium]